jgi:hypothetical protein
MEKTDSIKKADNVKKADKAKNILTKKIVFYIIIAIFAVVLLYKILNIFGFNIKNPFEVQPIVIDKTENIVEEIRQLGELKTTSYYQEGVIIKNRKSFWGDSELVLIVRGIVRVGFDLSMTDVEDIAINADEIIIKLPQVEIFDVITNPSDFKIFEESGKWSHEEVTEIQKEARGIIKKNAI